VAKRRGCLGCFGGLAFAVALALGLYALTVPWAFHIGGRWTPTTAWSGVGRLRDGNGNRYGLYLQFYPDVPSYGRRGGSVITGPSHPTPQSALRGQASVCTAQGTIVPFDVHGYLYGAWSEIEGNEIDFWLAEPGKQKLRRHFELHGAFHGAGLPLDDHKTMLMYFRPDGTLTPAPSYTSPVPEKHATVTLQWGNTSDFEALCKTL